MNIKAFFSTIKKVVGELENERQELIKKRKNMNMKFEFSKTSIEGVIPKGAIKEKVLADALSDWATCNFKSPPPNFGKGMVAVGQYLGITATGDSLMEYANKLTNEKDKCEKSGNISIDKGGNHFVNGKCVNPKITIE